MGMTNYIIIYPKVCINICSNHNERSSFKKITLTK
jgi:hypothetical protein